MFKVRLFSNVGGIIDVPSGRTRLEVVLGKAQGNLPGHLCTGLVCKDVFSRSNFTIPRMIIDRQFYIGTLLVVSH